MAGEAKSTAAALKSRPSWRRRIGRGLWLLATVLLLTYGGLFWFLRNPTLPPDSPSVTAKAEASTLENHVRYLTSLSPPRNAQNVDGLNQAANYIAETFAKTGCQVATQKFQANHTEYKNILCSFGPESAPRLVIGAHYDVYSDRNPGADDNASGVAGILELARLIGAATPALTHRLELVAFTLEEPPYFHSDSMGSYIHARSLVDAQTPLKLMIAVEMIGYFSDDPNSQHYPIRLLQGFYPSTANFIGVVGLPFDRKEVAAVKNLMTVSDALPVYSINAPSFITGVDFSDHLSYWRLELPAVMVTDTAFLRNANYHQPGDTADTLDYRRMALTVDGLYQVAVRY